MKKIRLLTITVIAILLAACGQDPSPATDPADLFPKEPTTEATSEAVTETATEAPLETTDEAAESTADDDMLQVALNDAGLASSDVDVLVNHRVHKDHGQQSHAKDIAIVKFIHGDDFYFYKFIDGNIVNKQTHPAHQLPEQARSQGAISGDEAKKIALEKAGVAEGDIRDYEIDVDDENGRYVHEIEFEAGDKDYEYKIDLYTGEIVKEEID